VLHRFSLLLLSSHSVQQEKERRTENWE
jgi:hypothetical protein